MLPLVFALLPFVLCYASGVMLLRRAAADDEMRKQLAEIALKGRRAAFPAVVLIAVGYLIWRQADPVRAEPLYTSAAVLILGAMLIAIIYSWIRSIRLAGENEKLRYRIAAGYSLQLLGILLASAAVRFL